jgi:hypothetical protein
MEGTEELQNLAQKMGLESASVTSMIVSLPALRGGNRRQSLSLLDRYSLWFFVSSSCSFFYLAMPPDNRTEWRILSTDPEHFHRIGIGFLHEEGRQGVDSSETTGSPGQHSAPFYREESTVCRQKSTLEYCKVSCSADCGFGLFRGGRRVLQQLYSFEPSG